MFIVYIKWLSCGPDSTVLVTRSGTLIATGIVAKLSYLNHQSRPKFLGFNDQNKLNLNARCGFFTNPRHKQAEKSGKL